MVIGTPIALIQVPNQRLFSVQAAAQYLGVDGETLRKWTRQGLLAAKDVAGQRRYTLEALDAFIDSRPPWTENHAGRKPASASKEVHV